MSGRDFLGLSEVLLAIIRKTKLPMCIIEYKENQYFLQWCSTSFIEDFNVNQRDMVGSNISNSLELFIEKEALNNLISNTNTEVISYKELKFDVVSDHLDRPSGGKSNWIVLRFYNKTELAKLKTSF